MENKMKKFGNYYRIAIWAWVIIANIIIYFAHIEHSWLIFIGNIMMFIMPGDNQWKKFADVMCGATVGMLITLLLLILIGKVSPVLGEFAGFIIPLAIGMFLLIYLHPLAPTFLNNVGFAYLVVCAISPEIFISNALQYFLILLIGGGIFNAVCILLAKPIKALVFKNQ